jgi:esterase/lipase
MPLKPMIENLDLARTDLGNIDLLFQFNSHDTAVLYFHGFPGPYEVNKGDNLRFVDFLFEELKEKSDFYYPLYTMCKKEPFSFNKLIEASELALDFLNSKKNYKNIILMGQSFGTVLALPLLSKQLFTKVILITPFIQIPKDEAANTLVKHYSQLHPELLSPQNIEVLCQEFQELAADFQPLSFTSLHSRQIHIYAAEKDEIIPINLLEKLSNMSKKIKLNTLKDETHVLNRKKEISELICMDLDV